MYGYYRSCYGNGKAEERFAQALPLTGIKREDIIIQSKCGLCFDRNEFDWTKENILSSVDDSLRRLNVEYLDALLLHRPDLLFDPEEVAEAFDTLEKAGKVRCFGVSNLIPMQIELLKKYVKQPLVFNQVQLSLEQSQLIDQALYMNNKTTEFSINRDGSALDYCRLHDITIQAWSPLQYGMFGGTSIDNADFPELNKALATIAERESYTAAKCGIAALTHALAVSLAGKVRVNSISPGWIDTGYKIYNGADAIQQPCGRVGTPLDIANMVMFLCSDKAGFITGENICIDGGMTKQMIYHGDYGWSLDV